MSLVAVALAAGLTAGLILGGSFRNLARTRLQGLWLLVGGAGCEFAARWGSGALEAAILIAGYVLLIAFALRNVATAGMVLVAVGLLANLTVICLNGGMPVRGLPATSSYGWRHHGERSNDRLTGLADVVPIPALGETVSAGDIVLCVGVATVVASLMRRSRRPEPQRPEPRRPTSTPA
jgi:hypothetical protein